MQNAPCPSCGAPVQFRSHASVLAVCEYCQTSVIKDAETVKSFGKMSDVLEDYSPIQIGTSGVHAGRSFSVIGRIQLRYAAGMWNEWYLMFDDGAVAWLGDSSGLYTLTTEQQMVAGEANMSLPDFGALRVAQSYTIGDSTYMAAEIRNAECIGGQGELPFKVAGGYRIRVADLRIASKFLTLDYTDGEHPIAYVGQAVTLEQLECQLLRDDDTVKTSAGQFKGKVDALACPSCGGSIKYLPGVTSNLICPSCQSQIDAARPELQVLAAGERVRAVQTTLELGAEAMIDGQKHQIIGLMKRADDENTEWTEYLLYNARGGFIWLVETDEGWARSKVQTDWPTWREGDSATVGKTIYSKLYEYPSRVVFAAGAFNWRVNVGDSTRVIEFKNANIQLAAEITDDEITWSRSTKVAADQIRAWFGAQIKADKAGGGDGITNANKFIYWILALNAIPLLVSFGSAWLIVGLAVLAIYLPAKLLGGSNKDAQ